MEIEIFFKTVIFSPVCLTRGCEWRITGEMLMSLHQKKTNHEAIF